MASRDADGGRAQKSKREGAYFFLVAFFFVAFFTVFFGAVFTAFFFAAFAAIVTLASLSPFEMREAAGLARQAQQNDAKWPLLCDESRNGPNRRRYTPAPTLAAGARVNGSDRKGWTPLHAAASFGHLKVVQALLEGKADPLVS